MNQLHLHLAHLSHNIKTIRSLLKKETKLVAVVKANAYGAGTVDIAKHLVSNGVDSLAVAYASEGKQLRLAGIEVPIMVFYPQVDQFHTLIQAKLEPALYHPDHFARFDTEVKKANLSSYPIHLKCNTGLNRIGLSPSECLDVLTHKNNFPFEIKSIYSHLGATEEARPHKFTENQIERFLTLKEHATACFDTPPLFHLLNTSGVFNYPEYQFDMVRVGIGLNGYANHPEWDKKLKPIAELSTSIAQIHHVKKGESVGYNQGWIATKDSQIAVLPLGHADGIARHFGHGKGMVWINGKKAPFVGNVCMDMLMVEVTDIDCKTNDRAVFFDTTHPASSLAKAGGTISYELLTGLSNRIERIVV